MLEKQIERKLVDKVKVLGGICPKWTGMLGAPDRMVLMPNGSIVFVELKAPGKKPRAIQLVRHEQLRHLGFRVYVIDSLQGVDEFIAGLK